MDITPATLNKELQVEAKWRDMGDVHWGDMNFFLTRARATKERES